jgi:hypothetical protein
LEEQLKKDGEIAPQNPLPEVPVVPIPFDLPADLNAFDPISALSNLPASQNAYQLPEPPQQLPQQQQFFLPFDALPTTAKNQGSPASSADSAALISSIGVSSLDWRLAMPAMASSLSRHLTEAFADSCCFLLPAFEFFRGKMGDLLATVGREDEMSPAQKVSLMAFCAVGARTSPHSVCFSSPSPYIRRMTHAFPCKAVLGISLKPSDAVDHPNAPLLSAGTRRQNASRALYEQAHLRNFEAATTEQATVENLAALLSVLQLTLFAEVTPSKSRPLLTSALSHYRELQDVAESEEDRAAIRRTFGFALYTSDCLISACARRKPLISDEDLRLYFPHNDTKIVVPRIPVDDLLPIVQKLVESMPARETALKSAKHLLGCWTSALQRKFAFLAARKSLFYLLFRTS